MSKVKTASVGIVGPVDGMNEKHPDGSYFRLVMTFKDDSRAYCLISRGAAETLRDELAGHQSLGNPKYIAH